MESVNIRYITQKKISPILQETVLSYNAVNKMRDIKNFDIHLNYGSLFTGYFVSRKVSPTIFDIMDDLPEMIQTSPQIPYVLKPFGKFLGLFILNLNIAKSKKITYISQSLKKDYNFPDLKSEYVPNGVDTELFKPCSVDSLRKQLNIGDDIFLIGYVGALREWVDLELVFKALKLFDPKLNIKFIVVGKEAEFLKNKQLADLCGVSENVIFTGDVPYSDVPKYISCMDVCLIPFKTSDVAKNSLPLKLFEYMACEKPVISVRLPAVIDAVGDRVIYASDFHDFYDNILRLYHNKFYRNLLGSEGRKFVKSQYDWSVICKKLDKLLEASIS
ncbi:glycosyltransferase family 4 protein [Methanosarcina vacuolata]|nr:glycosyltransferase family 4 protein [Methanosarcina vacuolata]